METRNLLNEDPEIDDSDDDEQGLYDEEDEHPFLKQSYKKKSFTATPCFKKAAVILISFIIAIIVGFLIGSFVAPSNTISPNNNVNLGITLISQTRLL